MARKGKKGKIRIDFRPNIENPRRVGAAHWTRQARSDRPEDVENTPVQQAFRGKGRLARKKTVDLARAAPLVELERHADEMPPDETRWQPGTVVAFHGRFVRVDDTRCIRTCVIRRVLRSLMLDQRNTVAVGDNVRFTPLGEDEGVIERIDDRHGMLFRRYQNYEHLIVANVDQALVVSSVAEPELRIHLVDRYIAASLIGKLKPVVVFNKVDLDHDEPLDEYEEVYKSLGYPVLRTSAITGEGIDALREVMKDRRSVLAGVSGVGKSSLINAIEPTLKLRVLPLSRATGRGQHTTSTVQLLKLSFGGYVVDTPGIRQFALWQIDRMNLELYFEEFIPYVPQCRFPDCTHTHEIGCAVKAAVEQGEIADWRYDSYVKIFEDQEEFLESWEKDKPGRPTADGDGV